MCRLYGFRASEPTRVECSLVHAQNALMEQSRMDLEGLTHGHGWGVAEHPDGVPFVEKQAWAAQDVAALARMLEGSGSKEFTEKTIDRLLADAGAALSRAGLGENAIARLLRLAREIVRTPVA